MIIGGQSSTRNEPTVELYNYESGEQCFLPEMPIGNMLGHAAWFENTALVCGGMINGTLHKNCTMFDQLSLTWKEVSKLFSCQMKTNFFNALFLSKAKLRNMKKVKE